MLPVSAHKLHVLNRARTRIMEAESDVAFLEGVKEIDDRMHENAVATIRQLREDVEGLNAELRTIHDDLGVATFYLNMYSVAMKKYISTGDDTDLLRVQRLFDA